MTNIQCHIMGYEAGYYDLLQFLLRIAEFNAPEKDRTGVGTYSTLFPSLTLDYDYGESILPQGYPMPLLRGKKMSYKIVVEELLWFLRGETNVKSLQEKGITIWDEWANENGDLGPIYGKQWRDFNGIDQIAELHHQLYFQKNSRRMLVSAWNPSEIPSMALPPCHSFFQCVVDTKKDVLNMHVYQRSADIFLGVPYNMASYATLLLMLCAVHQMKPGMLKFSYGDMHLYANHVEAAKQYVRMYEKLPSYNPLTPLLSPLPRQFAVDRYKAEHFKLINYSPLPAIPAPVAV